MLINTDTKRIEAVYPADMDGNKRCLSVVEADAPAFLTDGGMFHPATAQYAAALAMSAAMLMRLASISIASVALVRLLSTDQLTALANAATAPLREAGVRTQGPELALATTLRLIPLLSTAVEQAREQGHSVFDRAFWTTSLPELAASLYRSAQELTEA